MAWDRMVLTNRAVTACELFLEHTTINNHCIIPLPRPIRLGVGSLSDRSGFLGNGGGGGGGGGGREGGDGGGGEGEGGRGENGGVGGFKGDGAWRGENSNSTGKEKVSSINMLCSCIF